MRVSLIWNSIEYSLQLFFSFLRLLRGKLWELGTFRPGIELAHLKTSWNALSKEKFSRNNKIAVCDCWWKQSFLTLTISFSHWLTHLDACTPRVRIAITDWNFILLVKRNVSTFLIRGFLDKAYVMQTFVVFSKTQLDVKVCSKAKPKQQPRS